MIHMSKYISLKESKNMKKRIFASIFLLVAIIVIIFFIIYNFRQVPSGIFPFTFHEKEVTSITLKRAKDVIRDEVTITISDRKTISSIVRLLNDFQADIQASIPKLFGWAYVIILHTVEDDIVLTYNFEFVITDGNTSDTDMIYYGPPGYFSDIIKIINERNP